MPSEPAVQDSSSFRTAIDVRRFPWMRRLAADYAYGFDALAPFFAGDPAQPDAWRQAIARTPRDAVRRDHVADLLLAQLDARGAPPGARAAAHRLRQPDAVALVTGQQAGLFGGPLFTLLKAITALKLAERVTREHGVPAVAIFWVDAEDHDWNEVRSCGVLDAELTLREISLPDRDAEQARPVASVTLDDGARAALEALREALPPTEFTASILTELARAYQPGRGMAEAFSRWLEHVLGARGLVVFDAADAAAKPFAAPLFARELEAPGGTARLAGSAGAALAARGYHAQVTPQGDNPALFHLDGGRTPIGADRAADLVQEGRDHPERFSPNVLLRPIVQDTLFPTVAYVAGPNELAYLGQLRGVYESFGLPMPLMYPRASATIVDSAAARFLARYALPFETLAAGDESALNRLLAAQLPREVEEALEAARATIVERMTALIAAAPAIDPTLDGAARSTLGKMQHELQALHGKIIQAAKRRDETLRRQFIRTRAQAFPDGHPQERVVGFVSFLNRYGPALVDRLLADLPLDMGVHWVMTI